MPLLTTERRDSVVFGPAATQWYKLLARINLSSPVTTTAARVGADQLVFAPIHLGFFLSTMAYLEGASPRQRLDSMAGCAGGKLQLRASTSSCAR